MPVCRFVSFLHRFISELARWSFFNVFSDFDQLSARQIQGDKFAKFKHQQTSGKGILSNLNLKFSKHFKLDVAGLLLCGIKLAFASNQLRTPCQLVTNTELVHPKGETVFLSLGDQIRSIAQKY